MDNRILNEVKRNRKLMGITESEINEQGIVNAISTGIDSGLNGTNDEYKLLGMINDFLNDNNYKEMSFDEKVKWISEYRAPVGKFGVTLFNYLHGDGEKYDESKFNSFLKVFNNDGLYNNRPSDEVFIEVGKNMTDFQYSN